MARGFILGRVRARDRIDDDPDRQAGPNGQSRLDVDFAANKCWPVWLSVSWLPRRRAVVMSARAMGLDERLGTLLER